MRINNSGWVVQMKTIVSSLIMMITLLTACGASSPVTDAEWQSMGMAWRRGTHGVWELQWSRPPLAAPIVFEAWLTENRTQQRLEILEAPAPSLVGLAYVNDGSTAVIYNRLEAAVPPVTGDAALPFSPVTDALARVDRLLADAPPTATLRRDGALARYEFQTAAGDSAAVWVDETCGCLLRVTIRSDAETFTLAARSVTPLGTPIPRLFEPLPPP